MKLLLVTGIFPPDIGGPATYMPRLAESLVEAGESVELITLSDELDGEQTNYPVTRIKRRQGAKRRSAQVVKAITAQAGNADLIFANGLFGEVQEANQLLRKPQVNKLVGDYAWEFASRKRLTKQDMIGFNQQKNPFYKILRQRRNYPATVADVLITPSQFFKNIVRNWGFEVNRIEVIANGVEVPPLSRTQDLPYDYIACIGRLIPLKRLDLAIRLLGELPPEYHLVIVGDGPLKKQLGRLACKLGVELRVHFLGALPFGQTFSVLKKAKALLQLSQTETFSHTTIEAMAAGVPVIAAKVGGIAEIISHEKDGVLLDVVNGASLKSAIITLIRDENRTARLTENAQTTFKRYTWANCFNKTYQLIKEVAGCP